MTERTEGTFSLRHYARVLWRRKLIVIITTLAVPAVVTLFSLTQPSTYAATARVMVQNQSPGLSVAIGADFNSGDPDDRQIQTLASFVATPEIAKTVLGGSASGEEIDDALGRVTAEGDTAANVISITAESADAAEAADLANSFAESFVSWRRDEEQLALKEAITLVDAQLDGANPDSFAYQALVERRRQLEIVKALTTGGVSVAEAAQEPGAPAKPRPMRDGALALAAGLLLGVGLAFVREALDVSVHDVQELSSLTDLPVVGEIPGFRKDERGPGKIIALDDPRGPTAEAYRFLRVNLGFVDFNHAVKSILVTSQLPQQGKSTTVANLAISLLRAGSKVAVVEGDLRRPALHRLFNVPNAKGVTSVVAGATTLNEAVSRLTFASRQPRVATAGKSGTAEAPPELTLTLLTSGPIPPNPGEVVTSTQYSAILAELEETHDFVLVDAPPMLLVGDAATLAGKVDGVLIVLRLEQTTRDSVASIDDFVRRVPARTLGLVVTGVRRSTGSSNYRYDEYYD